MIAWRSVRSYSPWPLLLALASLGQAGMAAEASKLVPGDELPLLEATTLNGELVTLPRDARGHAVVLVVGFSKAAAKTTRQWLESCRTAATVKSAGYGVYCYDARMLESVPRLFRGSMERGMRGGFSVDVQRRTLLVYSGNEAWRGRLGAEDEKTGYIVGFDREGRVRGMAAGQFADTELKRILEAIDPVPAE